MTLATESGKRTLQLREVRSSAGMWFPGEMCNDVATLATSSARQLKLMPANSANIKTFNPEQ